MKVALAAPGGTVTVAGTEATEALLLANVTTAPDAGAGPFSVAVPCELLPPVVIDGLSVTEFIAVGATVRVAVCDVAPYPAEMVIWVEAATGAVVTVNVRLLLPDGTVTVAGTEATDASLLASVTTAPPDGAGPLSVTVPCELLPPPTIGGLSANELIAVGITVKVAVCDAPPYRAEIVT